MSRAEERALAQLRGLYGEPDCCECRGGGYSDCAVDGATVCDCAKCSLCDFTAVEDENLQLGPADAKGKRVCATCAADHGECSICEAPLFAWDDTGCCGACARKAREHSDEPTHDAFGRRLDYREREDLPGADR